MFRHEHRHILQLHRHFYTPHLYALESLYSSSKNKARFIREFEPVPCRLPVFQQIHDQYDAENPAESEVSTSDCEIPDVADFAFSPESLKSGYCGASQIEKSPRIVLSNNGSFLNTTQDESANGESPCKFSRCDSMSPTKILEGSDEEKEAEGEDLDVSLSSLGLDFV